MNLVRELQRIVARLTHEIIALQPDAAARRERVVQDIEARLEAASVDAATCVELSARACQVAAESLERERRLSAQLDGLLCVVCVREPRGMLPTCGHFTCCMGCYADIRFGAGNGLCPVCRAPLGDADRSVDYP